MTREEAYKYWIETKLEQKIRQTDYETALEKSSEADENVRNWRVKIKTELGIDADVYWAAPVAPVNPDAGKV